MFLDKSTRTDGEERIDTEKKFFFGEESSKSTFV